MSARSLRALVVASGGIWFICERLAEKLTLTPAIVFKLSKVLFQNKVLTLDFCSGLGYTINMMKVGDLVTMRAHQAKHGLIECAEVGIVQKIVTASPALIELTDDEGVRLVYHILWPDGLISNQYSKELTIISKV